MADMIPPTSEKIDLPAAVRSLFDGHANDRAPGLGQCITEAHFFLTVDHAADQIVLDKRAMLLAITSAGDARTPRGVGSALWLTHWLNRQKRIPPSQLHAKSTANEALKAAASGYRLILSSSMWDRILPRAHELARNSVKRGLFDLRHLLFALVELGEEAWTAVLPDGLSPEQATELKALLIANICQSPERGENVAFWQSLLPENAPLVTPEDSEVPPESLRTLSDQPAAVDRLGRATFAEALSHRLRDAYAESAGAHDRGAFMAHIHGPWGYGKSSVLNFLRSELETRRVRGEDEEPAAGDEPWLVVDFNAWKHQRIRPPWWSLISAVYDAARNAPEVRANGRLWRIWWGWRLRADWGPVALVVLLVTIGAVSALSSGDSTVKLVSGLITAGAAVFAATRVLSFGSAQAAQAYAELKTDPYAPVAKLYCRLVEAIGRPVAIFVDDLDRCDGSYIVELIEGIQTLLRNEPVTYVIAAERKWICAAFARKYSDFAGEIGEPARPLGYLFLDKLFQISAALPGLSGEVRKSYWANLLDGNRVVPEPTLTPEAAARRVAGTGSVEGLNKIIADAPEAERPRLRAAAAIEITRTRSAEKLEHRLQRFTPLLEPNPRAMKRLVNAVGMAQARAFLEGRDVALDTLARWTLVELRWPLLADHLAGNIDAVALAHGTPAEGVPEPIAALLGDCHVRAVIAPAGEAGLDVERLRQLLA